MAFSWYYYDIVYTLFYFLVNNFVIRFCFNRNMIVNNHIV